MKRFLERNLPPGYTRKPELAIVSCALFWTVLSGFFRFLNEFLRERDLLYIRRGADLILDESRTMPDFINILGDKIEGVFIFAVLVLVGASAVHYAYYSSGSKSIYLMRRLPDGFELHRRSLLVPLISAFIFVLMGGILLLVCYAVYMSVTPETCMTPNQWQKIWSVLQ